ncbi:MAG: 2-C-methyl-D-erythritol 2,4-cyclodiphosphate synthase [Candidatus Jettenia sp.]|uniref:2-C-methyl-D-erythritol 2,4-cyclodiphosphate synthase n=1 Tax=Candidatus Jettenia caeni TaxID=247490 RepID=I3IQP4_9BACT|nr:2-C-methyl-D-erythritol 2,4-cyclodiphosphate synthase [Candidatus Jettenia sp. AMX1]MBC6929980.1 2-C-methyl-D-erythritol 2,4-cyclodiphosphate synthase [Candidatus Jettenia sp.]NUN23039.1 2-C-methyl-D-erythritol 2,4-cyclodiphosphate synthase [Candidatus Jettenia caeni]KAA0248466.1 MAG: 2-C-methyl-D-erythritol 2,4-cyclodiphosphate synthase [Candidatus Jettenia sp. AMX1]MCE7881719.1 2-C-methyl-D-erythritol 2,4-cyclodiphosphate synthase [Candidatus Jettenia sp. AMX1]MCQ3928260.1 2-C-methyl-D-er
MLFGIGYDIHKLVENRKLVLGGVEFDYHLGLLGHSDADVVLHAVCDALLGAAALGDIGEHFPDTDQKWKGVSSKILLSRVADLVKEQCYIINNIDVMILAQQPKIGIKKLEMKRNIAECLRMDVNRVNIKATTMEGIDAIGRGEAIATQAIASLYEDL